MATSIARRLAWLLVLAAGCASASSPAPLPPQVVGLRVSVDAQGQVQTAELMAAGAAPAIDQAAQEIARKLLFAPARKNGVAVPSQTSLHVTLALEPRSDGQFALQLKRATSGPAVLEVGRVVPPKYQQGQENGALLIVAVTLKPDGTPDMATLEVESVQLRVPSEFAQARYMDAIRASLRSTRFELDRVDGVAIAERVSLPYQFGGGPKKPKPGERESRRGGKPVEPAELPSLNAVSQVAGIELPKIDFRAPAAPPASN